MLHALILSCVVLLGCASPLLAQSNETVRLTENFPKGYQYHVSCQVEITGTLPMPATKDSGSAKTLQIAGKSSIKYDERILNQTAVGQVDRTLRYYRQMEFQRKVGEEEQQNQLRPEARRLVILRHNQYEVPFCPHGPLTWGEIDLVRTDVFVPALQGMFPTHPVHVGESWQAQAVAIQELTDLEKIEKSSFVCTFEKVTTLLGRRNAHVNFEGKVKGIGEDGNALHELRGSYYLDIDANFLTYLYVKGTHHLLNKEGVAAGKIEGTFVLTRTQAPQTRELVDDAIRGLVLEPNADNTLLLFDQPRLGVRVLYPRNWHIAGTNDKQIGIDDKQGSGLLITLSPGPATPTGLQFYQETLQFLGKQQAKLVQEEKPRLLQPGLETFSFLGEIDKKKVVLQYYVVRQGNHGATIAVRMTPEALSVIRQDVDRIVRSLQLQAPK